MDRREVEVRGSNSAYYKVRLLPILIFLDLFKVFLLVLSSAKIN